MTTLKQPTTMILAVDGGGSKTLCWIADVSSYSTHHDSEYDIIGCGQAGPSNPHSVGFDQAFANLELAIRAAITEAHPFASIGTRAIAIACISLAGAGRPEEQQRVQNWAHGLAFAQQTIVVDDVVPLRFAAAYETRRSARANVNSKANDWNRSVTLVVGTGSIATGYDEHGRAVRSGGWGYLLGDEGSGYAIGLSGLRSICQSHDRGLALSEFQVALLERIQLSHPTQLIGWIYRDSVPRTLIAELAETVLTFAATDPAAGSIIDDAVIALTNEISCVANRLAFSNSDYSLALSGGILTHHPWLIDRILLALEAKRSSPRLSHLVKAPILGGLEMSEQILFDRKSR